nr:PTS transporter subunit EIIC [Streptococcus pyogenes]
MPNIGAFIAWGVLTALFIPTGWLPNAEFAKAVGPAITYLLPLLIGYTGGYVVHGQRGAVVGAIATFGAVAGAKTILEALQLPEVKEQLEAVLEEIRSLLVAKWDFDHEELKAYHDVIISRFENPYIVDDVVRVARTPIRKLGFDERFIRPIRELKERDLSYQNLLKTVAYVFNYKDPNDEQSTQLQVMLSDNDLEKVVRDVTDLEDQELISEIIDSIESLS